MMFLFDGSFFGAAKKIWCAMDPINIYTPVMLALIYQHQPDPSWGIRFAVIPTFGNQLSDHNLPLSTPKKRQLWDGQLFSHSETPQNRKRVPIYSNPQNRLGKWETHKYV